MGFLVSALGAPPELARNGASVPDQLRSGLPVGGMECLVEWGLAQRKLEGVHALGVDEIHWGRDKRADNFLAVLYQIDRDCRRVL